MRKWVSQSEKRQKLDAIKGVLTKVLLFRPCPGALNAPNRACLIGFARRVAIIGTALFWSLKQKNSFYPQRATCCYVPEDCG